mmetsp:Transcript_42143/g.82666  ORF Transcript_42143/g.82666 Transcript_42143/m.82666 type:complete len:100 (-) Transcript_42143:574-873(-)
MEDERLKSAAIFAKTKLFYSQQLSSVIQKDHPAPSQSRKEFHDGRLHKRPPVPRKFLPLFKMRGRRMRSEPLLSPVPSFVFLVKMEQVAHLCILPPRVL